MSDLEKELFLNMPGGYLRILYPSPEACLNLSAWKEFYNMDLNSSEGKLDISIDTASLTMTVESFEYDMEKVPHIFRKRENEINKVSNIVEVPSHELVKNDLFGSNATREYRLPGPFLEIKETVCILIDPRHIKGKERINE